MDYGARWYDAGVGRWTSVDPMAEKRSWVSPYNYVQNNPILRNDPTGALDEGPIDRILGSITAVLDNATGGFTGIRQIVSNNYKGDKIDFNAGLRQGDIVSLAFGTAEGATGAGIVEGSVGVTLASGGLAIEVTAPVAVIGGGMTVHGTIMVGSASRNLLNPTRVEAKADKKREQRAQGQDKRDNQPASEEFGKGQAKELKKKEGPDAARKAHDAKEKGAPERTKQQIREDYKKQF